MRLLAVLLALTISSIGLPTSAQADDVRVTVRVLDKDGRPVSKARVNHSWRANGTGQTADGKPLDLSVGENLKRFWGSVGQMESIGAKDTDEHGMCELSIHPRVRVVYAMSADRKLGGLGVVPPGDEKPVIEIRLSPVVTVKGRFRPAKPGQPVDWTHVYVELMPDPKRPIAIDRFISCGSFDRRFEFKVPAGQYRINGYAVSEAKDDDIDLKATTSPVVKLTGREKEIDVGWLELVPQTSFGRRVKEAKEAGRWRDYRKHYGEPAPQWHASDTKGIDAKARISDFKGKWVVLEFWGFGCAPCLRDQLPKLIEFSKTHGSSTDKLQIVSICIDFDGQMKTMKELETALARIEKNVWKGQKINFPIVLDRTFKTYERYGLPGVGTLVLVNPDGNLVEGDLSMLEATLNR